MSLFEAELFRDDQTCQVKVTRSVRSAYYVTSRVTIKTVDIKYVLSHIAYFISRAKQRS